jgi:uncharacterized protein (DUF1778 family)
MSSAQDSRLSIRTDERQKLTLKLAAQHRRTTVSQFVLEASLGEAERVLQTAQTICLPPEDFEELCRIMDAPPVDLPNLRKAMLARPVWDE